MSKEFKYKDYLSKYKNCPKDCTEKDIVAFRWVHEEVTVKDFYPINCHPDIAPRMAGDDDVLCTHYALSLYENMESAITLYLNYYNKQRDTKRQEKYKQEKGTCVTQVKITKEDGVCDNSPDSAHINLFEYKDCNLLRTIGEIIDIFAYNGNIRSI